MALLPGIDPRNRQSPRRPRTPSSTAPAPAPSGPLIPGLPKAASRINLGGPTVGTFRYGTITPYDNPNMPLQNPDGSMPDPLYGPGNQALSYNDESLFRNTGPFVGVGEDTGVAVFTRNGRLKTQSVKAFGAPGNTWTDFDAFKSARPQQIKSVQSMLVAAGLLSKGSFVAGSYDKATQEAMYVAMREGNMTGKSWWKFAEQSAAAATTGRNRGPQVGDTTTQTSYQFTTRDTALGLVKQAIQQDLGRDPTDGEVAKFLRDLRAEEKANPIVSTQTVISEDGDTSTTTEGGVDQAAWSDDYGERIKPGKSQRYKEAQYENMLIQMISDGSL